MLVKIGACGVCRTDLHVVDGELTHPRLPIVPGHEIVGTVAEVGAEVGEFAVGDRVGVPWLGLHLRHLHLLREPGAKTCATRRGLPDTRSMAATPTTPSPTAAIASACPPIDRTRSWRRGYARASSATARCAWRARASALGIYGFGAAAHIVAQLARYQGREIFAFTRPGDSAGQQFARELGATWAGGSDEPAPAELDAALLFAPIGDARPQGAAAMSRRAERVVCAGIHMSDIPRFPYAILWGERQIRSVANLTRQDGIEFIALAQRASIRTTVVAVSPRGGERRVTRAARGRLTGAAVLTTA